MRGPYSIRAYVLLTAVVTVVALGLLLVERTNASTFVMVILAVLSWGVVWARIREEKRRRETPRVGSPGFPERRRGR